jgi:peptidoglycan biosynthesis protein MviN/MurJ (putative lipid II flippase)
VSQIRQSVTLIAVSLAIRVIRFCRQLLLAYYIGVSGAVDRLLVAQMIPLIIVAMFGGSAGEIIVSLRKDGGKLSDRVVVLFTALVLGIGLVTSVACVVALPWLARLYGIDGAEYAAFRQLSLILLANVLPAMVVSIGTFLAFIQDRYREYAVVTIVSEMVGLLTIVLVTSRFQIAAFALATLAVSVTNAVLLWKVVGPRWDAIRALWSAAAWREIDTLWHRLRLVSGQVGVSYIGSFVERAMSVRVLADGYLSALGYSQSLLEVPNTMIAGSIGTTTYVRQTGHDSSDGPEHVEYTRKMFSAMFLIGCIAQVFFVAGLPLVLVALFRRGRFDNAAVQSTMVVGEILGTGLLAAILTSFWERTLYSLGEFAVVFRTVVLRVSVKVLMIAGGIFWGRRRSVSPRFRRASPQRAG